MFDELLDELGHVESVIANGGWANSDDRIQDRALEAPLAFPPAYRRATNLRPRARAERVVAMLEEVEALTTRMLHLLLEHAPIPPDLWRRFDDATRELRLENERLKGRQQRR